MKAKIKWYQEVLELEPSSKVFFPLARLFAENDQLPEAVATLKQGLERHPEHFEARMLLIDCLGKMGATDKQHHEIGQIGEVLGRYPGFWQSWAASVGQDPESRDAALALSFLSASFGKQAISWSAVIEQGLRSVLRAEDGQVSASSAPAGQAKLHAISFRQDTVAPPHASDTGTTSAVSPSDDNDVDITGPELDETGSDEPAPKSHARFTEAEAAAYAPQHESDDDGDDEPFSLRTLSMARVLAEQGDYKGAMEICDELSGATDDTSDLQRIEAFRATLDAMSRPGTPAANKDEGQPLQGKMKLISTLESLAERLEARASR